jgi:hypothetical protein
MLALPLNGGPATAYGPSQEENEFAFIGVYSRFSTAWSENFRSFRQVN